MSNKPKDSFFQNADEGSLAKKFLISLYEAKRLKKEIPSNLNLTEKIGEGGFGYVFLEESKGFKRIVKLFNDCILDEGTLKEAPFINKNSGKYIIDFFSLNNQGLMKVFETKKTYWICEFCGNYSFNEFLEKIEKKPRKAKLIKTGLQLYWNFLFTLKYLNEKGLSHNDIKPSNIMLFNPETKNSNTNNLEKNILKLIDFDIFSKNNHSFSLDEKKITSGFCSPEHYIEGKIKKNSDIYSAGLLFYFITQGMHPFSTITGFEKKQIRELSTIEIFRILNQKKTKWKYDNIPFGKPKLLNEIINNTLEKNPEKRYKIKDLISNFKDCFNEDIDLL